MINSHLIEPFSHAYRQSMLESDNYLVVDEIVRARTFSYRFGATLVSIGSKLMHGDDGAAQAA